jgi:CRISPR-associated protein Csd1
MERWEWEKTLSITCALINEKEELNVALDTENTKRDYLFGRLLAIADVLERIALGSEEQRATNAIRYMNAFSRHPERTWKTIQACLQPYQAKLGAKAIYLSRMIDEVASRIEIENFNNKPLSGLYLLGFYSQRHELYRKKDKTEDDDQKNAN